MARWVLERSPEDHEALNYLGWATLKHDRDHEAASNLFYRAVEGDERYYSAWLGLG
jgi:hypothetical protein